MTPMDLKETAFEKDLKSMVPARMDGALLERLAGAMDEAASDSRAESEREKQAVMDPELSALEKTLRSLVPHGMPENMIGRLDEAMSRWHETVPLEEKIVPLNIGSATSRRASNLPGFRAVATVALLGVGAAFLSSGFESRDEQTAKRIPVLTNRQTEPVVFTPGEARASVVSANDHGVVWVKDGLPVRCVEVESKREVSFRGDRGEKLTIAEPRREFMFTPVEFD